MAFTEFFCNAAIGSNLNSGSDAGADPLYDTTNGGWDNTTKVFTPASGDPSATLSVGMMAAIFADGAATAAAISRITAVDATSITLGGSSLTVGNEPATSGSGISLRVGGALKGPDGTDGMPFRVGGGGNSWAGLKNLDDDPVRVNLKNNAIYSITATIPTMNGMSGVTFQGYTATPGDGGKAEINGGTSGVSYLLADFGTKNCHVVDLIFNSNGETSSASGVQMQTGQFTRCVFTGMTGNGLHCTGAVRAYECEAYGNNISNTARQGGFRAAASVGLIFDHCISHHNAGSNSSGFVSSTTSASFNLYNCISHGNGGHGVIMGGAIGSFPTAIGCDIYDNAGDGLRIDNVSGEAFMRIINCNFVKNGGFGINCEDAGIRFGLVQNCGFGSGAQENTSGTTDLGSGMVESGSVAYPADVTPWVNPQTGDFRISLLEAKGRGRGTFTQTATGYTGAIGYPDIGAAAHLSNEEQSTRISVVTTANPLNAVKNAGSIINGIPR